MPIEIEAKMKLPDDLDLTDKLRQLDATPVYHVIERDAFFDTDDRHLFTADCAIRLRIRRHIDHDQSQSAWLTYKGARQEGQLKSREEIEFKIEGSDQAIQLFDRLGYKLNARYEKRRERWKLDGCFIELDQIPYLGRFIEIEGPTEVIIMQVRSKLDLDQFPLLTESYIRMLTQYLTEHNIKDCDILLPTEHSE